MCADHSFWRRLLRFDPIDHKIHNGLLPRHHKLIARDDVDEAKGDTLDLDR